MSLSGKDMAGAGGFLVALSRINETRPQKVKRWFKTLGKDIKSFFQDMTWKLFGKMLLNLTVQSVLVGLILFIVRGLINSRQPIIPLVLSCLKIGAILTFGLMVLNMVVVFFLVFRPAMRQLEAAELFADSITKGLRKMAEERFPKPFSEADTVDEDESDWVGKYARASQNDMGGGRDE
jgi:hypothetical protein